MKFLRATGFYSLKNIYICVTLPVIVFYLLTAFRSFSNSHVEKRESRQADTNGEVPIQHLVSQRGEDKPAPGVFTRDMFEKALVSGKRRKTKARFSFGLPSVTRPNSTMYLQHTLDSLLQNSEEGERSQIVLVIFLADFDQASRHALNSRIVKLYQKYFVSGLIQTIEAPQYFYQPIIRANLSAEQSANRKKWAAKQNMDYAFLMKYCAQMSDYYLQLEDDVTTVPGYIRSIESYMKEIPNWSSLEFCGLGFIGKLFHSESLDVMAQFLILFFNDQPNDVIFLHFNELKGQFKRHVKKPTLFQHVGSTSSLKGKTQDMLDLDFQGLDTAIGSNIFDRQNKGIDGPERKYWDAYVRRMKKRFCYMGTRV